MFKLDMREEVLWSWFLICLIIDNDCSFIGYVLSLFCSMICYSVIFV